MLPSDFIALAQQCSPQVSPDTMAAIVRTESGFNPYAIGVVHGRLVRQPVSREEAISTVRALAAAGWNFSVGLAQVNRANWSAYGLNEQTAFDPCRNLAAGAAILQGCFRSARQVRSDARSVMQFALRASLSCYSSGDFSTGYRTGYVQRVVANAQVGKPSSAQFVPSIAPVSVVPDSPKALINGRQSNRGKHAAHEVVKTSPVGSTKDPDDDEDNAVVF